ncbi:MAG: hypothetical protein E6R10_07180 [Rhodocyclaceae bacterium]|nr:MAG: hypothetical protein E6R10_07180 [Rhodocyclaceae bacterium]
MTETSTEYETQPDAFAVGIATAQAALDSATEQHRTAQAHEEKIKGRIKTLAAERDHIKKSRDGEQGDDEKAGARLALLAADSERLNELLAPASEATRAANQAVAAATSRLQEANKAQAANEAGQAAQALEAKLRELEGLFCRGLAELARLKREANGGRDILHGSGVFQPATALTRFVVGGAIPSF